jgi:hypothetical protein
MGTEAFWIPAAVAALSAAGQGVNQMQANKRQQNAQVQSIANQAQIRGQANSQVKALTDQIANNSPQQMAAKETGDFVNTLRRNQAAGAGTAGGLNPRGWDPNNTNPDTNFGAPTSALPPAAGASSRYKTDSANASTQNQQFGTTMADEVGKIDAAVRQRQNEGLAQQTLGTGLNQLGAQSYTQNFVDQLRAQTAGQTNPWVGLFSNMLQKGANAYATNYGGQQPPLQLTSQYSGGYPNTGGTPNFISGAG